MKSLIYCPLNAPLYVSLDTFLLSYLFITDKLHVYLIRTKDSTRLLNTEAHTKSL